MTSGKRPVVVQAYFLIRNRPPVLSSSQQNSIGGGSIGGSLPSFAATVAKVEHSEYSH